MHEEIEILEATERWSDVYLENGEIIKYRTVVTKVIKVSTPKGTDYQITFVPIVLEAKSAEEAKQSAN